MTARDLALLAKIKEQYANHIHVFDPPLVSGGADDQQDQDQEDQDPALDQQDQDQAEQEASQRLLRHLPVELQSVFSSMVKRNVQGLQDLGDVLYFLQDQTDAEFSYLPVIKTGKKLRPMRYVFGWSGKEQVILVPGKSYEFDGTLALPNPIGYPPYEHKHHALVSTPQSLWVRWACDGQKVAKRRALVRGKDLSLEQAYASELFLRTRGAQYAYDQLEERDFFPEVVLGPVANLYSPSLPSERLEFLDAFWIKDSPYFIFDVKIRELMEVYYRWRAGGGLPEYTYVFGFGNNIEDIQYDLDLAATRHILSTKYPIGTHPRNQMIADSLRSGIAARRQPLACVPKEVAEEVRAFLALTEARGRYRRSFCHHNEAMVGLNRAQSAFVQYKMFKQLKGMMTQETRSLDTGSPEAVRKAIEDNLRPTCETCGEEVMCLHRYCLFSNQAQFKDGDVDSEDNTWDTLQIFVESFFSNSKQQVFVCLLCGSSLMEDIKPAAGGDVLNMNVYSQKERDIIYNRIQYLFSHIAFPSNVSVKRSIRHLDKIIYNVIYNDVQRYSRKTQDEYMAKLNKYMNEAIAAYVDMLGRMVKIDRTRFDQIVEQGKLDPVRVQKYKVYMKKSVMVAYVVDVKHQNPVRDPVELYLSDAPKEDKEPADETNEVEREWTATRKKLMAEVLKVLGGIPSTVLDELTAAYFRRRLHFPVSLFRFDGDQRFAVRPVSLGLIYGENGARHVWDRFKVEGKTDLMTKEQLAKEGLRVLDRFSQSTGVFASQAGALDEQKVIQALAEIRDTENIVTYYATQCPSDDQIHEMENATCRKCGYNIRDPKAFVTRFKDKYAAEIQRKMTHESAVMLEKIRTQTATSADIPPETDLDPEVFPDLDLDSFQRFGEDPAFTQFENNHRVIGLILKLIRTFKHFVEIDMLREKRELSETRYPDIPRAKRAVLRLANAIAKKNASLQRGIAELINQCAKNYLDAAVHVSRGFSLYFNDFSDQLEVEEKSLFQKETMGLDEEKVFEDEEKNEDDTSEAQD